MAEQLIKVPDIGGAEGAEVVEVLVAPGDVIETEHSLVVVESDKASMEIPAPMSGVVGALRVAVGDTVSEGDVILALTTEAVVADGDGDAPNIDATEDRDTDADRQAQAKQLWDNNSSIKSRADFIFYGGIDESADQRTASEMQEYQLLLNIS